MTTEDTARLAAIRQRRDPRLPRTDITDSLALGLAEDDIDWLLDQLAAAQQRAERVNQLRAALVGLVERVDVPTFVHLDSVTPHAPVYMRCELCWTHRKVGQDNAPSHTADCAITIALAALAAMDAEGTER